MDDQANSAGNKYPYEEQITNDPFRGQTAKNPYPPNKYEDSKIQDPPKKNFQRPTEIHLIAFRDGSYKKVIPTEWKHSQWIHYTKKSGAVVMINPANVNYIERTPRNVPIV